MDLRALLARGDEFFKKIDRDGNGAISFDEWMLAFDTMDADGNHVLTRKEWYLRQGETRMFDEMTRRRAPIISRQDWWDAFRAHDINGVGSISIRAFRSGLSHGSSPQVGPRSVPLHSLPCDLDFEAASPRQMRHGLPLGSSGGHAAPRLLSSALMCVADAFGLDPREVFQCTHGALPRDVWQTMMQTLPEQDRMQQRLHSEHSDREDPDEPVYVGLSQSQRPPRMPGLASTVSLRSPAGMRPPLGSKGATLGGRREEDVDEYQPYGTLPHCRSLGALSAAERKNSFCSQAGSGGVFRGLQSAPSQSARSQVSRQDLEEEFPDWLQEDTGLEAEELAEWLRRLPPTRLPEGPRRALARRVLQNNLDSFELEENLKNGRWADYGLQDQRQAVHVVAMLKTRRGEEQYNRAAKQKSRTAARSMTRALP